jgi:hypothetical protein
MLVELGPETANWESETETPVMFKVAVPVFFTVTVWDELVVLTVTDPNASEVGVTAPCAVPVVGLPTVSVKVTDPDTPFRAHARTTT